ncbi:MAG: WhiB family transcriptional regulator [Pseudonocardia sp.]|nr:WhiB family transcriptional regulator [Pseudonocardia sp.]
MCGSRGVRFPSATRLPIGTSGSALLQLALAKAVCSRCTVVADCLARAMSTRTAGVWGGMSEDERTQLRRARSGDPPARPRLRVVDRG